MCQQAIEVRQQVWESSKSLKDALDHIEDIEDDDEPRILHGPIEELQIHVRKGLEIVSDLKPKARRKDDVEGAKESGLDASRLPRGKTLPINMGIAPGPSSLAGSMNRHPLGLFSTSPQFSAKASFASPSRMPLPSFTATTSTRQESGSATSENLGPLSPSKKPPVALTTPDATPIPATSRKQPAKSTAIAIDDGPLSVVTSPTVPPKKTRVEGRQDSVKSVSPASSVATFTTAITSPPLDASPALSCQVKGTLSSAFSTLSKGQIDGMDDMSPKKPELPSGPVQRRKVPRGLFSSTSTSGIDSVRAPEIGLGFSSGSNDYTISQGFFEESQPFRAGYSSEDLGTLETANVEVPGIISPQTSSTHSSGNSQSDLLSSQVQSPHSSITSTFSSPSLPETNAPASPNLIRPQPKPSAIYTNNPHNSPKPHVIGTNPSAHQQDQEEISQLAKELERAMNPSPTEPIPHIYFLQGEGLLQRIPNRVSMDDGLLNDDDEGQQSEELDQNDTLGSRVDGSGPLQSNGQLRRQRSGSRRQFRISRSRSRNRSRGRHEGRNKQPLAPIEIGHPGSLASSEWPFDTSPPRGRSMVSSSSSQRLRDHASTSSSNYSNGSHEWQTKAGPHLPFAESVTVGNPIRVGKGVGSFTVYSVSLKLCGPATLISTMAESTITGRGEDVGIISEESRSRGSSGRHAGHVSGGSATNISQHPNNTHHTEGGPSASDRDTGTEHHRPNISNTPSKASLMMTRSFSFPELGSTAEQLLISMQQHDEQLYPLSIDTTSSVSGAPNHSDENECLATTTNIRRETPSAKAIDRIIHVRKRYSDFVILRAQLVEMLRGASKTGWSGGSLPAHGRQASTSALGGTNGLSRSNEDMDEDIDNTISAGSHSRTPSGSSNVSTSVLCRSILRGMPKLPPKKVVGKFRPAFVEKRRRELEYFLEWVVAHPVVGDCPVVVQWFLGTP